MPKFGQPGSGTCQFKIGAVRRGGELVVDAERSMLEHDHGYQSAVTSLGGPRRLDTDPVKWKQGKERKRVRARMIEEVRS